MRLYVVTIIKKIIWKQSPIAYYFIVKHRAAFPRKIFYEMIMVFPWKVFTGQVSLGKLRINKVQQVFLFQDLFNMQIYRMNFYER